MVKPVTEAPNLDDVSKFIVSPKAGEFVFREGDAGTEMFVIQEGRVEILKQRAGEQRQVAVLEVGDFFGEMSLLEEQPREVSARAATEARLLRIDQSTFDQIVQEDPEIAVRMLRKLSRRLREMQDAEDRAAQIALGPIRQAVERQAAEAAAAAAAAAAPTPASAPPADTRPATLVERASGTRFSLGDRAETTVGRPDHATGFTPDVDLSQLDTKRTLSRRHAKIVRRDGDFFLREEIGTRNGTFVNGARIATGTDVKLSEGDQVRFGLVDMVFQRG